MPQKLGQHFLKNQSAVKKIIESLDLKSGDTVIEIGPGEGALTFPLLEAAKKISAKVVAIERDHELVESIKQKVVSGEAEILEGDALRVLPELTARYLLPATSYKVVGNIPYYITGHLLRIISELENKPELSVLMVQKEVAERICAKPPKMNLLAAITQLWADPELILRLKPGDFDPPPKVHSAVIRLVTSDSRLATSGEVEHYYQIVKTIFKQPRKTAANNLADGLNALRRPTTSGGLGPKITKKEATDLIKSVHLPENARPQDFSLDKLIKLSTTISKYS